MEAGLSQAITLTPLEDVSRRTTSAHRYNRGYRNINIIRHEKVYNITDTKTANVLRHVNPFMPTVPKFAVRETSVSDRKCWNGGHEWVNTSCEQARPVIIDRKY